MDTWVRVEYNLVWQWVSFEVWITYIVQFVYYYSSGYDLEVVMRDANVLSL